MEFVSVRWQVARGSRTDAALTAYGGLAAWSGFLKHLGIIERFAEGCPVARTSPGAAPVREVLHSFALSALVEGKRFCHVRWLTDDPAIATIMNMASLHGVLRDCRSFHLPDRQGGPR